MAQARASTASMSSAGSTGDFPPFSQKHLLSIADLKQHEIIDLLDRAERMVPVSRQERKSHPTLSGKTQINLFFESSHPYAGLVRNRRQAPGRAGDEHVGQDQLGQ